MKIKSDKRTFIIAEAGVNHNGSLKIARKMVDAACQAGADAIKFQTFVAEEMATSHARMALYQKKEAGSRSSQLSMLKKMELDAAAHRPLINYCVKKNIVFLSSPFDLKSIELLDGLGVGIFKIPSGEITNLPYLRKIGNLKKKVILSTGMSDLNDIKKALNVLMQSGVRKKNIVVLHCNTEYPTPPEDVNLRAMLTIRDVFGVDVGYSDHTLGIEASIAAVVLGASVIEKHFTLNKSMSGPDHKASLEPDELKKMVMAIRRTEKMLGSGEKRISRSERKNIKSVRKSIVAAKPIKKGERFTEKNLGAKRPGTGLSPMKWDRVVGGTAKKDFAYNEPIKI